MIKSWKFIDTNEIILELCWSYLGLSWTLKNYNKIKAHVVNLITMIAYVVNVELKMNRLKITVQNSTRNQIIIVNTRCIHKILFL